MLKQHFATCLLASALIGGPALAQQTQPGQPPAQQQPDATRPAQPGAAQQQPGMTGSQSTGSVRPLAGPSANQMLSSDFRGTAVYGANDERIGNVDDLLIDQNGQIAAVIIGIGGFLGIGEKNVAIPFQAFEIVPERPRTGTTATTTPPRATTATIDPDRVVLRGMTRADLEAAPTFRKDGAATGTATGTGATGATGGPAGSTPSPTRPTAPAR